MQHSSGQHHTQVQPSTSYRPLQPSQTSPATAAADTPMRTPLPAANPDGTAAPGTDDSMRRFLENLPGSQEWVDWNPPVVASMGSAGGRQFRQGCVGGSITPQGASGGVRSGQPLNIQQPLQAADTAASTPLVAPSQRMVSPVVSSGAPQPTAAPKALPPAAVPSQRITDDPTAAALGPTTTRTVAARGPTTAAAPEVAADTAGCAHPLIAMTQPANAMTGAGCESASRRTACTLAHAVRHRLQQQQRRQVGGTAEGTSQYLSQQIVGASNAPEENCGGVDGDGGTGGVAQDDVGQEDEDWDGMLSQLPSGSLPYGFTQLAVAAAEDDGTSDGGVCLSLDASQRPVAGIVSLGPSMDVVRETPVLVLPSNDEADADMLFGTGCGDELHGSGREAGRKEGLQGSGGEAAKEQHDRGVSAEGDGGGSGKDGVQQYQPSLSPLYVPASLPCATPAAQGALPAAFGGGVDPGSFVPDSVNAGPAPAQGASALPAARAAAAVTGAIAVAATTGAAGVMRTPVGAPVEATYSPRTAHATGGRATFGPSASLPRIHESGAQQVASHATPHRTSERSTPHTSQRLTPCTSQRTGRRLVNPRLSCMPSVAAVAALAAATASLSTPQAIPATQLTSYTASQHGDGNGSGGNGADEVPSARVCQQRSLPAEELNVPQSDIGGAPAATGPHRAIVAHTPLSRTSSGASLASSGSGSSGDAAEDLGGGEQLDMCEDDVHMEQQQQRRRRTHSPPQPQPAQQNVHHPSASASRRGLGGMQFGGVLRHGGADHELMSHLVMDALLSEQSTGSMPSLGSDITETSSGGIEIIEHGVHQGGSVGVGPVARQQSPVPRQPDASHQQPLPLQPGHVEAASTLQPPSLPSQPDQTVDVPASVPGAVDAVLSSAQPAAHNHAHTGSPQVRVSGWRHPRGPQKQQQQQQQLQLQQLPLMPLSGWEMYDVEVGSNPAGGAANTAAGPIAVPSAQDGAVRSHNPNNATTHMPKEVMDQAREDAHRGGTLRGAQVAAAATGEEWQSSRAVPRAHGLSLVYSRHHHRVCKLKYNASMM